MNQISQQLKKLNIDAYLIYDFRGSNYIGREILGFKQHTTRRWIAIVDQETTHWIVPKIEKMHFDNMQGSKHIVATYQEFQDTLKTLLTGYKAVAADFSPNNDLPLLDLLPTGLHNQIQMSAPEIKLVSSADLTQSLSALWGQSGYNSHKAAVEKLQTIFDKTFEYIQERIQKGEQFTDYDAAQYALSLYEKEGIFSEDGVCIVATNEHSSNPHYYPHDEVRNQIKPNSVLLIDMWAKLKDEDSIYADFTKMAWIGPDAIPANVHEIWDNYVNALEAGVEFVKQNIKKGIQGWEVDQVIRSKLTESGYGDYLVHRSGHSLGKYEHGNGANLDDFETHDTRQILPDTGITLEPGIYLPEFGVRTEINIYIHPDYRVELTVPIQKELIKI